MEAEQRKHPRIDGGRGRKCRSTGGGPIGGADRRAEVQSKGQIGGSEVQSEGRIGGAEVRGRAASRSLESAAWKEQRWLDGGGAPPDSRCRCRRPLLFLSLYSLSLPISRFCVLLGWGAPTQEVYALDFPRARFPPPFFPRAQPILRPCSVRLDESDAKATTRAREATP